DHSPPRMEQFLEFLADARDFKSESHDNVIAVHCKAGKGRTGSLCCAWLLYAKRRKSVEKALEMFAERPPPPPGLPASGDGSAAAATPPGGGEALQAGRTALLREWQEQDVMQHMPLVAAARVNASDDLPVELPTDVPVLLNLLEKLGYSFTVDDPWQLLGFARLEGPAPSELSIASRLRSARYLLSAAIDLAEPAAQTQQLEALRIKLDAAETRCMSELGEVLRTRRKVKSQRANVYQELGLDAVSHTLKIIPAEFKLATQPSDVLAIRNDRLLPIAAARTLSETMERGDAKLVDLVQHSSVVVWLPSDSNALTRCLAAYLRRFAAVPEPPKVIMITPIPNITGELSVDGITDLWSSSILSATWTAFVKEVVYIPFPFELLSTASNGTPRHFREGLGMFSLRQNGPVSPPRMLKVDALLAVPGHWVVVVDMRIEFLTEFLQYLRAHILSGISYRFHKRSAASTTECPRITVELIMEGGATDIESMAVMKELRRQHLPPDTFYAFKSILGARDSLILEFGSPASLISLWPFCSQLYVLDRSRALLFPEALADAWKDKMDELFRLDAAGAASRLRCRPSFHGGHLGKDDSLVLDKLMQHAAQHAGLNITRAADPDHPRAGEYMHVPIRTPASPSGSVRALVKSQEEIRKIYAVLHGQPILVGHEHAVMEVRNDLVEVQIQRGRLGAGRFWPRGVGELPGHRFHYQVFYLSCFPLSLSPLRAVPAQTA
ncbi:unnamed protein product, partial [Prorocentrum cordatum]